MTLPEEQSARRLLQAEEEHRHLISAVELSQRAVSRLRMEIR